MKSPDFLDRSVIVAAHPDDEILWFTAIMEKVDKIIIVFQDFWAHPELGAARAAAISELPHPDVTCLQIAEPGTNGCADWNNPQLTDTGIRFGREATRREVGRMVKTVVPILDRGPGKRPAQSIQNHYDQNFIAIHQALNGMLEPGTNVFTHNPWGEYGHEDHIQVFRAVDRLRREKQFRLWMSNYCTDRAATLATSYFTSQKPEFVRLPSDPVYAEKVAEVYRKHDCWTWNDEWQWFEDECYMEAPVSQNTVTPGTHLFPLNFFKL